MGFIVDILSNISSIRLFSNKQNEMNYLNKQLEKSVHADKLRDQHFLKIHLLQDLFFIIFQVICFVLLVSGIIRQVITPGDFVLVLILNISIITCLRGLAKDIRVFAELFSNLAQGLKVYQSPIEVFDIPQAKKLAVTRGKIIFENICFCYPNNEPIFRNILLKIPAGQKVGLVGYSGSKKSTLVNLLLRLYDVSNGRILIDDQNIQEVTQESLRKCIGVIPQDLELFNPDIFNNIKYGSSEASYESVIQAARSAHSEEFVLDSPQKYSTIVGERGRKLSGGERQRIAIARAILKNAPILILDEATNQLDIITEQKIQQTLKDLMKNKTTIVIAHRISTLLHMDRI